MYKWNLSTFIPFTKQHVGNWEYLTKRSFLDWKLLFQLADLLLPLPPLNGKNNSPEGNKEIYPLMRPRPRPCAILLQLPAATSASCSLNKLCFLKKLIELKSITSLCGNDLSVAIYCITVLSLAYHHLEQLSVTLIEYVREPMICCTKLNKIPLLLCKDPQKGFLQILLWVVFIFVLFWKVVQLAKL